MKATCRSAKIHKKSVASLSINAINRIYQAKQTDLGSDVRSV